MKGLVALLGTLVALGIAVFILKYEPPPPEMTEAEIARYEAEVRQELINRLDAYQEAVMRADGETAASFWTSDGRILAPGLDIAGGDLHAFYKEVFPTLTVTDVGDELLELFVHGDVAYGIYRYWETIGAEGQEPEYKDFHGTIRWEKEDGVWKLDRSAYGSFDTPEGD